MLIQKKKKAESRVSHRAVMHLNHQVLSQMLHRKKKKKEGGVLPIGPREGMVTASC